MSSRWYVKKGEVPDPEVLARHAKNAERSEQIQETLFSEKKGFQLCADVGGGYIYKPDRVRGCVCHQKPVVMLAIEERKNILDPDYEPRWICICRECFIRTEAHRTPEMAVNAWNHGILTKLSRLLHKRLTADTITETGISNLLSAIGKQAGTELEGYYRMKKQLMEQGYGLPKELSVVNGYILDLEGFFAESFFFMGLDPNAIIEGLKKRVYGEDKSYD